MISVLCCHVRSVYKTLGLDCYDKNRHVFSFTGDNMVIAHPPCRTFSKLRYLVRDIGNDYDLAAYCISKLKSNGGILEQPARSTMMEKFSLHKPVYVDQGWFGYPLSKPTWLWFFDCDPLPLPFVLGQKSLGKSFENMSYYQRSATPLAFAHYLKNCIERSNRYAS